MALHMSKKRHSQTVVKAVLFTNIEMGGGRERPQYRTGLRSKYSTDKWGFITKEQGGNQDVTKGKHRGKG